MGEHGPLARELSNQAQHAAPIIDAVALEERLKVARELRAEAIARRQSAASPRPVQPAPPARPAQRPPAADAVGWTAAAAHVPAAPALPIPRRASAVSAQRPRDGLRAPPIAHPLVALLALGLTLSWTLAREAPEQPARPAVEQVAAATPPAAAPPAEPIAEAEPEVTQAVAPPTSAPKSDAPRPEAPPPATIEAAAAASLTEPEPPAPMPRQAVEPAEMVGPQPATLPVATPRPQRILVNAPRGAPADAVDAAVSALRQGGFVEVANQPTRLTISSSSVRFYHPEDAAAASEAAALVGPLLPGGAEARDFTEAPSRGAPGHLEIWVAGEGPSGSGATARRARPAPGTGGAEIQRLVDSVADAARGLDAGAERFARDVDSAIGEAFRALEGRR